MSDVLSPIQLEVLRELNENQRWKRVPFNVGEALRRRGLLERSTTYVIKHVYATDTGEHLQFRTKASKPVIYHEWSVSLKGIRFLDGTLSHEAPSK